MILTTKPFLQLLTKMNTSFQLISSRLRRRRLFKFPYCPQNEIKAKRFLSIKNLFSLKDKSPYPSCQIYQGTCNCGETYIGETVRNVKTTLNQDVRKTSEPAKHLSENPDYMFEWKCLLNASSNTRQRKNLEASFIAILGPSLNNQIDTKKTNFIP